MRRLTGNPPRPPVSAEAVRKNAKWRDVPFYAPTNELVGALELAIDLRHPLLITGPPGSGKTSAAYWAAWQLNVLPDDFEHVQVRSDSTAQQMKYEFESVRYFREAQLSAIRAQHSPPELIPAMGKKENKRPFFQDGPLWRAFERSQTKRVVLLFDEIDKAPRDFPNDLLHEFDTATFNVPELPDERGKPTEIPANIGPDGLALIVLTSNGERALPDAFLRRCLYHHVSPDRAQMRNALERHLTGGGIKIDMDIIDRALDRFQELQDFPALMHRPGLAELLVWIRAVVRVPEALKALREHATIAHQMYLGALLKREDDMEAVLATQ